MHLIARLNNGYYIVNGLYLIVYIATQFKGYLQSEIQEWDWSQILYNFKSSGSILLTLIALGVVKSYKSCSAEQFLRTYFNLSKITIFARYLFVDATFAFIHLFIYITLYLFFRQPNYQGNSSKITPLKTKVQFDDGVLKYAKRNKKRDENVLTFKNTNMQFVEFYRNNHQLSNDAKAIWINFAEKYATQKFKFYSVDVDKVPEAAQAFDINISQDSAELPTIILFEEGTLKLRFPVEDGNTFLGKQLKQFKRKAFEKYFRFHDRWYDTKDSKGQEEQDATNLDKNKNI